MTMAGVSVPYSTDIEVQLGQEASITLRLRIIKQIANYATANAGHQLTGWQLQGIGYGVLLEGHRAMYHVTGFEGAACLDWTAMAFEWVLMSSQENATLLILHVDAIRGDARRLLWRIPLL